MMSASTPLKRDPAFNIDSPFKNGSPFRSHSPVKSSPLAQSQSQPSTAPPSSAAPASTPTPPPLIPTSWLAPYEQRRLVVSVFGLIEVIKIWDVVAPYILIYPDPTWSSRFRVRGPWTVLFWTCFEMAIFATITLLRIPQLHPSPRQLLQLLGLVTLFNVACWFVAEPGSFFMSIHLIGPAALGGNWYWAWWYALRRWWEPPHLEGRHIIRLRPFSTATLNPMSLSFCIPPDSSQPLFVPIVFNNSIPEEVSYYIRSLETGSSDIKTIHGSSLHRAASRKPRSQLAITDDDGLEDEADDFDPLSALVLRSQNSKQVDVAKLPSIKPSDSLYITPPDLAPTQYTLFLPVSKPSIIHLQTVLDKSGDRFHIAPHREAIIVECPTGGDFVDSDQRGKRKGAPAAELRCVGDEEIVHFTARGVGTLRAAWRKRYSDGQTVTGVIEGIQDDVDPRDELALVPRDRITRAHSVPLRMTHDRPGRTTVTLTSVMDALHNSYTPGGHSAEQIYDVRARPSATFNCGPSRELLLDQTATLPVNLNGLGGDGLELIYFHTSSDGHMRTQSFKATKGSESITVSEPGVYTLQEIKGQCPGSILEPSTCLVELIPPPTVGVQFTTLHECSMDVGITVAFDFTGTPPFTIEYTEKKGHSRATTRTETFRGFTGEVTFRPEQDGQYTYSFISLKDKKYAAIQLDQPPVQQTVRPLANIGLLGSRQRKLYSCSVDQIEVEVDAKGSKPLKLTYLESWKGRSTNTTIPVSPGKQRISIDVPSELKRDKQGVGKYSISLVAVEDGNHCARKLIDQSISVEVDRQKSSARFADSKDLTITEGDTINVPLRLTGHKPWTVKYNIDGKDPRSVTLNDPNGQLSMSQEGQYRLLEVHDAHCPGEILNATSTFDIHFKPRPALTIPPSPRLTSTQGVQKHRDLCAGQEDEVVIKFTGEAPFELGYKYTVDGKSSRRVLKSAQNTGLLYLSPEPGHHRYDLLELKDSNYASTPISEAIEHTVHSQPSGSFVRAVSHPLCLDGLLKGDAKLRLQGKAPFNVDLLLRRPGSNALQPFAITVDTNEWTLDLPYEVKDVGRHEITVESISDASGCQQDVRDSDVLSTGVDVVESARIVPITQQYHLCVGDMLDFLLQGKAPWTVEYEWVGRKHKVTSSSSRFSRYAEEQGIFRVRSVALKDNQCKREIDDVAMNVHPLPKVKVQNGMAHLREGDEPVAFKVLFDGTAPFSFTYTRSEIVGGKPRIMETQTIGDISENSYTITSSAPGDYEVISVSDKWCRYPRVSSRDDR